MKKRFLSLILAVCLILPSIFVFTACGSSSLPPEEHVHNWSTKWTTTITEHWLDCDSCEEKKDLNAHDFVEGVCSVCLFDVNHEHDYGSTYLKDNEWHWQSCSICSETTQKEVHNGKVCSICGYIENQDNLPRVSKVRDLELITIRAGAGYATLVKLPDGKNMLIDTGGGDGTNLLSNLLWQNIEGETLEYLVITSSHPWRNGGTPQVFANYNVLNFYRPNVKSIHSSMANVTEEFNKGDAVYEDTYIEYARTIEYSSYETGCNIYIIDDTSCDFTYEFLDENNNYHSYTIDFISLISPSDVDEYYEAGIMFTIEYNGKIVFFTGQPCNEMIDNYCNTYGNQKDVDVLITFYAYADMSTEYNYAISRSDLRGTNFLKKINLTKDKDYCIIASLGTVIAEMLTEIQNTSIRKSINSTLKMIKTKITSKGEITLTEHEDVWFD